MFHIMPAVKRATTNKKKAPARRKYTGARPYYAASKPYVRGRGAYYIKGSVSGRARLPGLGRAQASLEGAYLSGMGAYSVEKIRRNIFLHADPPAVRNSRYKEGAVIIRHREYIGDVVSSPTANSFNLDTYPLNPAQSLTFPWLSSIAQQFEEYMINGMVFEFKSTASDAIASSTNLALGNVIMATSYDPLNPPFSSQMEMLNYEYAQSCKVSESAMHMIECDPRQTPLTHLYTRVGTVPGNADLRLYDFGSFQIATSGLQGSSINIGQLWVTYEFCFYKAKVNTASVSSGPMFKAYLRSPMGNNWFGSSGALSSYTYDPNNSFDVIIGAGTAPQGFLTFPKSNAATTYLITISYSGWLATSAFNSPLFSGVSASCKIMGVWQNNTNYADISPVSGSTTTKATISVVITTLPGVIPQVSFASGQIPGSGTSGSIDIIATEIAYLDPSIYPSV